MLLIAAREELTKKINAALVFGDRKVVTRAADPVELRHRVHQSQAAVVVLDADLGEDCWQALDAVPRMRMVRSRPRVIVVSDDADAVKKTAAKAGCFDVVSVGDPQWLRSLACAVAAALAARQRETLQAHPRPPKS